MLKQHNQLMLALLVGADAVAVVGAWLGSYWLRFAYLPVDPSKGVPGLWDAYLPMLPLVVLGHLVTFQRLGLYRPRRSETLGSEFIDILKAFIVAVVVVVVIDYFMPQANKISRRFLATYAVSGTSLFLVFRLGVRAVLRRLRRLGFNRRFAAIIGSGRTAQRLRRALRENKWTGIKVAYFVDDHAHAPEDRVRGVPVVGPLARLPEILAEQPVDAVFVALPAHDVQRVNDVLATLDATLADVRLVPDVNPAYAVRPTVSELDGVPILALRQSPLYGWNALVKRAFDLGVGGVCLIVAALPMLAIAALVKLGSAGPVLYRQRRMSLDGREFTMIKFRTMRADAERDGPVWSQVEDRRRTRIGAFLRQTSLDELPNLFNVLAGQMSLVGPRPERPEFIATFRHEIPQYMLRHKIKAGMTGFAQVRGWRGDSSLRKRIQHDVYYIRHWSVWLDLRILVATLGSVWFSRHERRRSAGDTPGSSPGAAEAPTRP